MRAVVTDPAGCVAPSPYCGGDAAAFREGDPLGIPKTRISRLNPTAHTLACLRFAGLVAETVARLATGSGGLTLGRAGFAPAGRHIEVSQSHRSTSVPLRPAEPGRTLCPMPDQLGAGERKGACSSELRA